MEIELTKPEVDRFKEKIKNFMLKNCPICGEPNFLLHKGELPFDKESCIPTIIMTCEHCGHITTFSSKVIGI